MTEEEKREKKLQYARDYYRANRDKMLKQMSAYHKSSKGRDTIRKRKFGISPEAYDALFEAQGGKCAVCSSVETGSKNHWHTDHCHSTGVVRGILCHHCNVMLGMAKDNATTLMRAIEYLTAQGNRYGTPETQEPR